MANRIITPDIIAREAAMIMENELVMGGLVYTDYSDEFVKVGSTISVRKPVQFTVTDGATMDLQDLQEGKTTVSIDKRKHVAFEIPDTELTLSVDKISERYIQPAVSRLAHQVDTDLMSLYSQVYNWVGTPGETINAWSDFARAPQRLMEMAVPMPYVGVLSPADNYGLLGSFTALPSISDVAKTALTRAQLPVTAGAELYVSQQVPNHTCGTRDNTTPAVNDTSGTQSITYATGRDSLTQSLICDGLDANATVAAGDVFTIGTLGGNGIYAINPVTKARLPYLQQFVVTAAATADGSGNVTLTISPQIIVSGPYQAVSLVGVSVTNNLPIAFAGTASTGYPQNMVFHKNAFALVTRPLELMEDATQARRSYKNTSILVTKVFDGINMTQKWRLDILYGVKAVYPQLATRISGTA